MPINTLSELIKSRHLPNYYTLLLDHHDDIIRAVLATNQTTVAEQLNVTRPQFSAIYNLLLAYSLKVEDNG